MNNTHDEANALSDEYARVLNAANDLADAYRATLPAPTEPGLYSNGSAAYQVVRAAQGHLYALRLNVQTSKFEYVKGAKHIERLRACDLLDFAGMQRLGRFLGRCLECGAVLSTPQSVQDGFGPVCIKKVRARLGIVASKIAA